MTIQLIKSCLFNFVLSWLSFFFILFQILFLVLRFIVDPLMLSLVTIKPLFTWLIFVTPSSSSSRCSTHILFAAFSTSSLSSFSSLPIFNTIVLFHLRQIVWYNSIVQIFHCPYRSKPIFNHLFTIWKKLVTRRSSSYIANLLTFHQQSSIRRYYNYLSNLI